MILSINRTKTITPKSLGNDKEAIPSTVTYRVPTAEDVEKYVMTEKAPDSKMFSVFVTETTFTDEKGEPIKPADFPKISGVYPLISEIANAIVNDGMLGVGIKNG